MDNEIDIILLFIQVWLEFIEKLACWPKVGKYMLHVVARKAIDIRVKKVYVEI